MHASSTCQSHWMPNLLLLFLEVDNLPPSAATEEYPTKDFSMVLYEVSGLRNSI